MLCSSLLLLRCVPDVWGLHEWSDWLTPTEMFIKHSKRYDTVFYKASLTDIPKCLNENDHEVTHIVVSIGGYVVASCHASLICM